MEGGSEGTEWGEKLQRISPEFIIAKIGELFPLLVWLEVFFNKRWSLSHKGKCRGWDVVQW